MPLKSPFLQRKGVRSPLDLLSLLPLGPLGMVKGLSPELEMAEDLMGIGKGAMRAAKASQPLISSPLEGDTPPVSQALAQMLEKPPTYEGEMKSLLSLRDNLAKLKGMKRSAPYQDVVKLMSEIGPKSEPRELREVAIRRQTIQQSFDNIMRAISQMGKQK